MPKLKPHRGMKKRIKLTGTGKLLRRHAMGNHLLAKKSGARKRNFAKAWQVKGKAENNVKRMLGS